MCVEPNEFNYFNCRRINSSEMLLLMLWLVIALLSLARFAWFCRVAKDAKTDWHLSQIANSPLAWINIELMHVIMALLWCASSLICLIHSHTRSQYIYCSSPAAISKMMLRINYCHVKENMPLILRSSLPCRFSLRLVSQIIGGKKRNAWLSRTRFLLSR